MKIQMAAAGTKCRLSEAGIELKWLPENPISAIALDDSVMLSRGVVSRRLGATTILVNIVNGTYFGLDEAGSRIWELLLAHSMIGKAAAAMAREYAVTREVVAQDVLRLVRDLHAKQLVRIIRSHSTRNGARSNVP